MNGTATRHGDARRDQALGLRWPIAAIVFLFSVSYPANDFIGAESETDIGFGLFLVFAAVALAAGGIVFGLVVPRALRGEHLGITALGLAVVGLALAPGFWIGVPPALAAGGALLGWGGLGAEPGRRLSQAAFMVGVVGVVANVASYVDVFV